jgi:hypothetical protein
MRHNPAYGITVIAPATGNQHLFACKKRSEETRMHWTIGKVKITKIVELETVGSTRFILPLATNEEIQKLPWLIPHFANEEGRLKMSIHALVVETPTRRIVVDTGLGNDKEGRKVPTWNNRKDQVFRLTASTRYCAPICMSIMSAGTPNSSLASGYRPLPMRAMSSEKPNSSTGATTATSPTGSPSSTIP